MYLKTVIIYRQSISKLKIIKLDKRFKFYGLITAPIFKLLKYENIFIINVTTIKFKFNGKTKQNPRFENKSDSLALLKQIRVCAFYKF